MQTERVKSSDNCRSKLDSLICQFEVVRETGSVLCGTALWDYNWDAVALFIGGRHFLEAHGNNNLLRESQFTVLRKCQSKFDCLVFEMLFIKKLKPNLNIQTDSIRAKLFV